MIRYVSVNGESKDRNGKIRPIGQGGGEIHQGELPSRLTTGAKPRGWNTRTLVPMRISEDILFTISWAEDAQVSS